MAKKGLLVVAVVVAALLVAPKIIGTQTESTIKKQVENLNATPGYVVTITEYHNGWFTSNLMVDFAVDFSEMEQSGAPEFNLPTLTFAVDVAHGPILLGKHAGIGSVAWNAELVSDDLNDAIEWEGDESLYTSQGKLGLFGGGDFSDRVAAFTFTEEAGQEVIVSEYTGTGEVNSGMGADELVYGGALESIQIINDGVNIQFSELAFDAQAELEFDDMFAGKVYPAKASFELDDFTMELAELEHTINLKKVVMSSDVTVDDDRTVADMSLNYAAELIQMQETVINNFVIETEFNDLDVAFLEAYQELSQEMATMSEDEMAVELEAFAEENLLDFTRHSPEAKLTKFEGSTNKGDFSLEMKAQVVDVTELPEPVEDPQFWMNHFEASGSTEVGKELAQMLYNWQMRPQMIMYGVPEDDIDQMLEMEFVNTLQSLIAQGLLVEEDEELQSSFEFKDAALSVNDTVIPLPGAAQ